MMRTITRELEEEQSALVQVKIIYWGPAESGKTTSLLQVAKAFSQCSEDELIRVQTTRGRTLWNEYGAFRFQIPAGGLVLDTIVHLSAVTGQERFLNTREYTATSADGVIFVADCRPEYIKATLRSFEELAAFMPSNIPVIVQANFQDLDGALNAAEMEVKLDQVSLRRHERVIPTIAKEGMNVSGVFIDMLLLVLKTR